MTPKSANAAKNKQQAPKKTETTQAKMKVETVDFRQKHANSQQAQYFEYNVDTQSDKHLKTSESGNLNNKDDAKSTASIKDSVFKFFRIF